MQITRVCPGTEITTPEAESKLSLTSFVAPFDEILLTFFQSLSKELIQNPQFNRNAEVVSLSHWLRKANLLELQKQNEALFKNPSQRIYPLGDVFHVCPANVDTIFVYSICVSVLMGNRNFVRISSEESVVVGHILQCMNKVLQSEEFSPVRERLRIFRYGHDDQVNMYFSKISDGRMVWGGDSTVSHFKKLNSNPLLRDFVFPNRVSAALINGESYLRADDAERQSMHQKLYNDSYLFDQKGCASPQRIIFLLNESSRDLMLHAFYKGFSEYVKSRQYGDPFSLASLKLLALAEDVVKYNVKTAIHSDSSVYLVEASGDTLPEETCGGGYFYFSVIHDLEECEAVLGKRTQTLSHWGFLRNEWERLPELLKFRCPDRIVPLGTALSFQYVWDGMNLFETLSRKVWVD